MALYEFRFPELGEGLHEGRIDKWTVKPGDIVKEDDTIAEVENDKALVELPSPVDGKVLEIKVPAGNTATVGELVITFEVEGAGNATESAQAPVETKPTEAAAPAGQATAAPAPAAQATASTATAAAPASVAREVLATPGVRKFAREQGVNLTLVHGTGPHGKITKQDVEAFLQGGTVSVAPVALEATTTDAPSTAPVAVNNASLEERVPLTTIRKRIAEAMARSAYTAPHVTLMDEVNVTELVNLRNEIKPLAAARGTKITYLPFVVKAMCAALRNFPELNATLENDDTLVLKRYYHIGIATDTDRGLLVPVIRDADKKNMWTIASEIEDLATRGRSGKLQPNELKGSTMSITNIGSAGGMFFTPIINYPEVSILGVGRITEKPIMQNGQVVGGQMMSLSLSFDHRIIDGALAQRFINELKRLLENPRLLLMEV